MSIWRIEDPSKFIKQIQLVCDEDDNGCWIWPFGDGITNRPELMINRKRMTITRWILWAITGELQPVARHTCDVGLCCNPEHLIWGTYVDNNRDWRERKNNMIGPNNPNYKGKYSVTGEDHGRSKFTEDDVKEIRKQHLEGKSIYRLALNHGVQKRTISMIVRRITWKHI